MARRSRAMWPTRTAEQRANQECETLGLPPRQAMVGPEILHGIEINPVAAELARTTIWIGDIQWRIRNAIYTHGEPILRKLDAIECRDALIAQAPTSPLGPDRSPGLAGEVDPEAQPRDRVRGRSKQALAATNPGALLTLDAEP